MTRFLLLFASLIPSVFSQSPIPWSQTWNITESRDYVDNTFSFASFTTDGLSITWSNSQCTPALCIKRALRPIPDVELWQSHCSHYIASVPNTSPILPRIGYYHVMVYRSTNICSGVLTLSGSVCAPDRVFDGGNCELPIVGTEFRNLNPGIPITQVTIPPQGNLPDVGKKTFLFNNEPSSSTRTGNLYINASGVLSINGRYGAPTRLPFIYDFQYNMTNQVDTLTDPFEGMRVGSASISNNASYGLVEYVTLINYGNTDIMIYNLTSFIDQCPPGQYGKSCMPLNNNLLGSDPSTSRYLVDLAQGTSYVFFKLTLPTSSPTTRLTLLIQKAPGPANILPSLYIRQGALPYNEKPDDSPDNHYDIYIPAENKKYIFYDFGEFETKPDWYIALTVPSGTLTPVIISVQRDCPSINIADCSGAGTCNIKNHECECKDGWTNFDCSSQQVPSDEIELPSSWRYSLFMLALVAPIFLFFILRRHLNNLVNRPSLASQGQGLGMGHPGHVLGGNDIQDSRRWQ